MADIPFSSHFAVRSNILGALMFGFTWDKSSLDNQSELLACLQPVHALDFLCIKVFLFLAFVAVLLDLSTFASTL